MALDEKIQKRLEQFVEDEGVKNSFYRDPSTNNIEARKRIRDPKGKESFHEPAGLAEGNLQLMLNKSLTELTDVMNGETYQTVKDEYKLNNDGYDEFYVQLLRRQAMLPQKENGKELTETEKGLYGLAGLIQGHYSIIDLIEQDKVSQAVDQLDKLSKFDEDLAKYAYHYKKGGDLTNSGVLAYRFADMMKRVAKKNLTNEHKKMLDMRINADNSTRAIAAVELYKVYGSGEEYQAPKEDFSI